MGDRCYMELTCRKADAKRFEADLGFYEADDLGKGLVQMVDEEANYGHSGDMPTDIPYFGWAGEGGGYGACRYACDGKEYAEVPATHDGDPAVRVGDDGLPDPKGLEDARKYIGILKRAKAALGIVEGKPARKAKPRPAGKPRPFVVTVCRTGFASAEISVTARGEDEARDKAVEAAGDVSFSEHDASYEATGVKEK